MSFEMKGAFSMILDLIYQHGGMLPHDIRYISGNIGMSVRKLNEVIPMLVEIGKLNVDHGMISNTRADSIIMNQRSYQDKQAINRSRPNKNMGLTNTKNHQPEPEPEPEEKDLPPPPLLTPREKTAAAEGDFDGLYQKLLLAVGYTDEGKVPIFWRKEQARPFLTLWLSHLTAGQIIEVAQERSEVMPVPPAGPKALSERMKCAWQAKPHSEANPDDHLQFLADWVNGEKHLPQNAIGPSMHRTLLERGFVTPERFQQRGFR